MQIISVRYHLLTNSPAAATEMGVKVDLKLIISRHIFHRGGGWFVSLSIVVFDFAPPSCNLQEETVRV